MNIDLLLIDQFLANHPEIAIAAIEGLDTEEIALLIETLSLERSLTILSLLPPYKAGKVLEKVNINKAVECVENIPFTNAELILRVTDKLVVDQILKGVQSEKAKYLRRVLSFRKDQVGAYMEPYVFTLFENFNIGKAIILTKKSKAVVKPNVFILNKEKKLVGYLDVNELITNDQEKTIQSLMKVVPRTLLPEMSVKDVLDNWDHRFIDLPVVKVNGEFIGTVSLTSLTDLNLNKKSFDNSALKAGSALGELYVIGLTSLLGSVEAKLK